MIVAGKQQEGQQRARHVPAPRAFREGPGGEHHEGGLHEFGRLQAERADHDPAMRALDLGTVLERQQDQDHPHRIDPEGQAAQMAQRQERDRDHDAQSRDEEHHLPVHEMEGRQAEPLRDRRPAGHEEDETGEHEDGEACEQKAVDRPPPIAESRAFRARHHLQAPLASMPGKARTRSRKWFPRTS